MEQDRKLRNKLMHLEVLNEAKRASSINGTGKTGQLHVKEIRTLPNTIHKDKLKMD